MEERSRVSEQSNTNRVELMADSRHVRRTHSRSGERTSRKATERSSSMSVSYHGSAGKSTSKGSRGIVGRYKSSDNMDTHHDRCEDDGKASARGDSGLGASTLHGKSSVSRIRDGEKTTSASGSRSSSKSSSRTRAPLKRAMSNDNVLPPEAAAGEVRRGRRRPTKQPQQSYAPEETAQSDDDDDSFADGEGEETIGQISPLKASSRRPAKQRRDLLVLLREKKTVQLNDFCECKDNRRVLHFLLYQHKLGVDLEELQAKVDKDMGSGAIVPRPITPLFVEPT